MTAQSNRFERHAGKVLAALWVAGLIAVLAITEWMLSPGRGRYQGDSQSSGPAPARHLVLREWKRNTDYRLAPPAERRLYAEGGVPDAYRLSTDAQGFIEPALRHPKPDLSIVFLGGSTTECAFVAPEDRFPHLAARKLEEALGVKVNGINAARSGNNSMHSLVLFLGKIVPLKPDYVVLTHAANDLGALTTHGTYWIEEGSLRMVEDEPTSVGQAGRVLVKALIPYTSERISQSFGALRRLVRSKPASVPVAASRKDGAPDPLPAMGRTFEASLRSFVRVATAWGITPVLATQVYVPPASKTEQTSDFLARERQAGGRAPAQEAVAGVLDHFNGVVRAVARSEGVPLIDVAAARTWAFGDVYDGVHFTDSGSRLVAEIIAAGLKEQIARRPKAASK
jgi:lysophospholipase L1-like esterase